MIFSNSETIPTILSGFYDLREQTRDILIALPGLTLTTRRFSEARRMLITLSHYFKEGLLPERLPTAEQPLSDKDYSSIDTTLWYFYALDAYLLATDDESILDDLYHHLDSSMASLIHGTRNGIRVDMQDGLLLAQHAGKALTWMNAYIGEKGDEPLTLRSGKAVEVNALWYNALSLMREWAERLHQRGRIAGIADTYEELRGKCKDSFNERFWYSEGGYLYDVIDGPQGNDAGLRPNQLFSLSLRHAVLDVSHQRPVLNIVTERLLTPYGLRSLAPPGESHDKWGSSHDKSGSYMGRIERHNYACGMYNGGAWPWLVGCYVDALLRVEGMGEGHEPHDKSETYRDELARKNAAWLKGVELLEPYRTQPGPSILGMPASVYSGDEPQKPYSQIASARSVGELLRVYKLLAQLGVRYSDRMLPA